MGEVLECKIESGNLQDRYAVAVQRRKTIVGHVPRKISAACSLFLQRAGRIRCTVIGVRCYSADLPQGGLEVPCAYVFLGEPKDVAKIRKLLAPSATNVNSETQQPRSKKRKVGPDVIDVEGIKVNTKRLPKTWLTFGQIRLTEADRDTIILGGQLTDQHINVAQAILFHLNGLCSTLLISREDYSQCSANVIQIVHTRGKHWIVVSTIGCSPDTVQIFDSLYTSTDEETLKLILQLFGSDTKVEMVDCPKQQGVQTLSLKLVKSKDKMLFQTCQN